MSVVLFLTKPKSHLLSRDTANASNRFIFPSDILVFPALTSLPASRLSCSLVGCSEYAFNFRAQVYDNLILKSKTMNLEITASLPVRGTDSTKH